MTRLREYIKSFGRVTVAPPARVVPNRKGKGSYRRARAKKEARKLVKEALYGKDLS